MAALSGPEVAAYARAAGFDGASLVTALAVAKAESGWRTDAIGDVALRDATWGPSVGLWQIRSVNAERGKGTNRDELANLDPAHNARAAYAISGKGTRFTPWTMYTNGGYRSFLGEAQAAAGAVGVSAPAGGGGNLLAGVVDAAGNVLSAVTNPAAAVAGVVSSGLGGVTTAAGKGLDFLTGGAVSAVQTVGDAAQVFARFLGLVANPDTWRRLGLILAGVAVVGVGFALINRDALGSLAKDAIKEAPMLAAV